MNEPTAPATPAAPTPTISATRAASDKGDFAAFDDAALAERRGTPLARVTAPPVTPPPSEPPAAAAPPAADPAQPPADARAVSKRQQQINDYERRIAEQDQRIRALETGLTRQPPTERQPAAPAQPEPPTWQAAIKAPDISREMLSEDQFFQQFPDAPYTAYARYAVRYDDHVERAEVQTRTADEQRTDVQQKRVETFMSRLDEAKQDPAFVPSLSDEVKALKPVSGLAPGERNGPLNILWELVYDSPHLAAHLRHFSAHPDDLRRIEAVPPEIQSLPVHMRTWAHIQWILQEFGAIDRGFAKPAASAPAAPAPSPVSAAPPPAPILTRAGSATDPQAAALARNDFAAWDRIETEKERQRRGHA